MALLYGMWNPVCCVRRCSKAARQNNSCPPQQNSASDSNSFAGAAESAQFPPCPKLEDPTQSAVPRITSFADASLTCPIPKFSWQSPIKLLPPVRGAAKHRIKPRASPPAPARQQLTTLAPFPWHHQPLSPRCKISTGSPQRARFVSSPI